jgi:hypothetical protein
MTERGRIAVLGLYRSGSTAIAGALHRLGVAMGEPFWCDYYEPQWLSQELRRWWNEPYVRECMPRPQRVFVLAEWINALERTGVPWVGAKHPLLSLCGEDVLEAWGCQTRFIWSYRPVQDSIRSLTSLRWFPNPESLQGILWAEVTRFCEKHEHLRVEFDHLVSDPAGEIRRILCWLRMTPDEERLRSAIDFVNPAKKTFGVRPALPAALPNRRPD